MLLNLSAAGQPTGKCWDCKRCTNGAVGGKSAAQPAAAVLAAHLRLSEPAAAIYLAASTDHALLLFVPRLAMLLWQLCFPPIPSTPTLCPLTRP